MPFCRSVQRLRLPVRPTALPTERVVLDRRAQAQCTPTYRDPAPYSVCFLPRKVNFRMSPSARVFAASPLKLIQRQVTEGRCAVLSPVLLGEWRRRSFERPLLRRASMSVCRRRVGRGFRISRPVHVAVCALARSPARWNCTCRLAGRVTPRFVRAESGLHRHVA
jgi:hypothetical protein